MNQEAGILCRAGTGGQQNPPGTWRNALVLRSQPSCDFCHGFTPALIYSELEVAQGHQIATKQWLPDPGREQGFGEVPRGFRKC